MNNLKTFEELSTDAYRKAAETGNNRNDKRGARLSTNSLLLMRKNSTRINLYNSDNTVFDTFIPLNAKEFDQLFDQA